MSAPGAIDPDAFNAFERASWAQVVAPYADNFGSLTTQAIGPLLDAVGADLPLRLLDVACGPGWLSAAARDRGARPTGIDAAEAMVIEARRRYPDLDFQQGDAENLSFADGEFDAVGMNFGLLHMGRPERALQEANRVLRPGGQIGFTVWAPADEAIAFKLILGAIQAHGTLDVPLPPGPPFFRFSDPEESRRALTGAGFMAPEFKTVQQVWRLPSPEALFTAALEATARTRGLLREQTPAALAAIRAAIVEAARPYQTERGVELPMPAVLASARKPKR